MTDDEFDALLRDAARTYNPPSDVDDADAMWNAIDRALPPNLIDRPALAVVRDDAAPVGRRVSWASPWLRMAAVLVLGVLIGRLSTRFTTRAAYEPAADSTLTTAERAGSASPAAERSDVDRSATNEYLGRATVLLAALPDELRAHRADPAYLSQADALLLQTRLLLDSPAAADPQLRSLFDDLELVLAQVVRLHGERDSTRIELLNESLQQRDVLPRLRDAVADNAAN
jgi:hypothetical protein